jgi:hypothetical protein
METETIIAATPLVPFRPIPFVRCRSCGCFISTWDRFRSFVKSGTPGVVKVAFCPGGKEPTEMRGMLEAMMTGNVEGFNPCAGVSEPHLHVQCRGCGFEWLMRTKEAKP